MSLVANINRRRKLGISRSKKKSTISAKAYKDMQNNWKKKSQEIIMPSHYDKKKGDLDKDGKMSKYETRRDRAIKNAIAKKKRKKQLNIAQWRKESLT